MALLLAGLFLLSFTGIRLMAHHCLGCETTGIVFASSPNACCGTVHQHENDKPESSSCCHSGGETSKDGLPSSGNSPSSCDAEQGCCDFEVIYLKNDFEVTQDRVVVRIASPITAALFMFSDDVAGPALDRLFESYPSFEHPPPRLSGRDFLLSTHQLKVS